MQDFTGNVAVITGAGRGIGRGIALRCAREGMKVVLAGIGMDSLTRTEADLQAMGAETLAVQTDVSRAADVEALAEQTIDRFGAVHLLVNNAGVAHYNTVWESSLDDWSWVIGVSLWGVVYGVRTFIPRMMEGDGPCHIVNVSSMNGVIPGAGYIGSYAAAKHAVVALSESLYYELAEHAPHINVSVFIPGQVNTDIPDAERSRPQRFKDGATAGRLSPEAKAAWKANLEAGLTPDEAADVLFEGIREDRLYVGVQGFKHQFEGMLTDMITARAEAIFNERNPELP